MASMDNVGRDCRDFLREQLLNVGWVECAMGPGENPYHLFKIHILLFSYLASYTTIGATTNNCVNIMQYIFLS